VPALRLTGKLLLYYGALVALLALVVAIWPGLAEQLPVGRVEALLAQAGQGDPLAQLRVEAPARPAALVPASLGGSLLWLIAAILGALAAAVPVSQVYMAIRDPEEYDQSLVDTVVVLPMVVTMIVVIVQHSLALAFSLAGIAGAARYRNSMKSSGDLLFILLSIGIGLSAGIGAVELAVVGSAAFNLAFVALWGTRYGERSAMKRYMGGLENGEGAPGGKHGKKHKHAGAEDADAAPRADDPVAPAPAAPPPGAS
jgi:hypothetical protein